MTRIVPIGFDLTPSELGLLAERRLSDSPYYFLKNLSCQFNSGVLTVRGRVPDDRLRQIVESIVARVPGVKMVANCVEVYDPTQRPISARPVRNAG